MNTMTLMDELADSLTQLDADHLRRRRRVVASPQGARLRVDDRELINFCGNDYLGLANHPALRAAAKGAIDAWGVGSGASHLVCGHQGPHEHVEDAFARFVGLPAALYFSTGYMANLGVITALVGRGDAVFADKLAHASLNDACVLSRADFHRFPHNDLAALARQLAASKARRKLIAVDAVYSMDGDLAPVAALLALAAQYDAWLYLDDAHGFGVLGEGRGSLAHWQVASPRIIYLATLGKAVGTAGALVAAERTVIDWLINKARTAIYTTAAPAAIASATSVALGMIETDHAGRARLFAHIGRLRAGLVDAGYKVTEAFTPIQPILLPSSERAMTLSQALFDRGFWVAAIRPPTVPTPRLRLTLSAAHGDDEVDGLLDVLRALR